METVSTAAYPEGAAASFAQIPSGRYVHVARRGTFFVRDAPGPPGAPTVVLIHGWVATGGLNWFRAFEPLARSFRVIALDMRGHGRGLKAWRRFRLEDCADDVAAVMRALGTGPAIVAGYSMGGPISQLLWQRHAPLVAGLVQCATSDRITPGRVERLAMGTITIALASTTRLGQLPAVLPRWLAKRALPVEVADGRPEPSRFAIDEMRGHDVRMLMEAGYAISRYDGSEFTPRISVPTAVLVTLQDTAVVEQSQLEMAARIPDAECIPVADGHMVCREAVFGEKLLEACRGVASRIDSSRVPDLSLWRLQKRQRA